VNSEKYIGLDVHQATISVAVMDSTGRVVMESILETKAATILEFFAGLRGTLSVTCAEGTWAAWLYDLLKPHVDKLVVCNPRKNAHNPGEFGVETFFTATITPMMMPRGKPYSKPISGSHG
jgi:hypothetical protein